jgi:hypothetical protein
MDRGSAPAFANGDTSSYLPDGERNGILLGKAPRPRHAFSLYDENAGGTAMSMTGSKSQTASNMQTPVPAISIIMVCDYAAGEPGGWMDIRKSLAALAIQDLEEPAEFILCESEEFRERPADRLHRYHPRFEDRFRARAFFLRVEERGGPGSLGGVHRHD